MEEKKRKRARTATPELAPLRLSETLQEALYWSRVLYGQHPSAVLPPPPGLEKLGRHEPSAGNGDNRQAPPSVLRLLDRWVKTNPIYGTAALESRGGALDEKSRIELMKAFLGNIPQRMRETPIRPEISTASFDGHMLTLGRKYGQEPGIPVPACCNGSACAALKVRRAFGTPLQRYYTPAEDEKLQADPSLVEEFGPGPCLICIRHDVETLVRVSAGRCVNPREAYGQPYAVLLRVYNSANVPGGYRGDVFSSTPVTAPDISPAPLVASRTEDIIWQYDNGTQTWFIDQNALVYNPGMDF